MSSAGNLILRAYRTAIEFQFQHHPDKETAVSRLMSGECSMEEVDLLFAEAESASWKWLNSLPRGHDNGDGTVTFEMYKGAS